VKKIYLEAQVPDNWRDECNESLADTLYGRSWKSVINFRQITPAAGPWRTDAPPRDGTWFLAKVYGSIVIAKYRETAWSEMGTWRRLLRHEIQKWAEINPPEVEK